MIKFHGWYVVKDQYQHWSGEDYDWATETFGKSNPNGRWFYSQSNCQYYFKQEKDAMLFELGFGQPLTK